MITIKSLKRITEAAAAHNIRYIDNIAESAKDTVKKEISSERDLDEDKFEAAKAEEDSPGVLHKLVSAVSEHPYIAAGTVAGIAGLVALQKRKQRLPEPGSYN